MNSGALRTDRCNSMGVYDRPRASAKAASHERSSVRNKSVKFDMHDGATAHEENVCF